jgi:hypothetical protein
MSSSPSTHFVVAWRDARNGEVLTARAREIRDSSLGLGFIAVSDFIWDTRSLIVNPAEEALSKRFERTKTLHLSIHCIVSIEEVGDEHQGLVFEKDKSNLVIFSPDKRL